MATNNKTKSKTSGVRTVPGKAARSRKSEGQPPGQFSRDPKRRTGQFTAAGDPPLMKK